MKDEFNELDSNVENEAGESNEGIKYEENDNWKFDGEATTLNDTMLENDEIEITIPASKSIDMPAEKPSSKPAASAVTASPKKRDGNALKFTLIAIFVAICIAVTTVLGVFYYNVPNSDEKYNKGNVALVVGDTNVSIGMYNYYYTCISQNYITYAGYGYYDLDTTKDYATQMTTDSDGKAISWAKLFEQETINQIQYITAYYQAALEAGVTLTEEQKSTINSQISSIKETASSSNVSVDEYIKQTYGDYCGLATLEKMLEQCYVAENYYQQYAIEAKPTEKEVNNYFEKNRDNYLHASFAYLQISYDDETKKQADVEKSAKEYASKVKTVDDMKTILPKACASTIDEYVKAGYFEDKETAAKTLADNIETSITKDDKTFTQEGVDWLFSDKTKVGSCSTFTDEENKLVYIVLKTGNASVTDDEVYSVRHILVMPRDKDGNVLEDPTKGTDAQFAEAKKTAESILEKYNKGEKTEVSFAKLAEKYSDDEESTSKGQSGIYGGLCAGSTIGQMVKSFEDWSTDKSRKYGDVDIVKSKFGYHIIYFIEDTTENLYECEQAVVKENEDKFVENISVKKNKKAFSKTKVATPVEASTDDDASADDDDSDN